VKPFIIASTLLIRPLAFAMAALVMSGCGQKGPLTPPTARTAAPPNAASAQATARSTPPAAQAAS